MATKGETDAHTAYAAYAPGARSGAPYAFTGTAYAPHTPHTAPAEVLVAGEHQRDLLAAYRNAYNRLLWEGWGGELDDAISESPEIDIVHQRYRTPDPVLTPEQQQRVDERVAKLMADLL